MGDWLLIGKNGLPVLLLSFVMYNQFYRTTVYIQLLKKCTILALLYPIVICFSVFFLLFCNVNYSTGLICFYIFVLFTFMHLADAFMQSNLQCIFCQYVCSLGIEPTIFALQMQCSTTEPQEHISNVTYFKCFHNWKHIRPDIQFYYMSK